MSKKKRKEKRKENDCLILSNMPRRTGERANITEGGQTQENRIGVSEKISGGELERVREEVHKVSEEEWVK